MEPQLLDPTASSFVTQMPSDLFPKHPEAHNLLIRVFPQKRLKFPSRTQEKHYQIIVLSLQAVAPMNLESEITLLCAAE